MKTHNPSLPNTVRKVLTLSSLLIAASEFMGCYTQFYTNGYVARSYHQGYKEKGNMPDSLSDSSQFVEDSLDSKQPIIVNNYYEDNVYRGHTYDDWDYPLFSFSYHSGYYSDYYNRPYWWNRQRHNTWRDRNHYGNHQSYPSSGNNSQPANPNYHSEKRLFNFSPTVPPLKKGKRRENSGGSSTVISSEPVIQESAPAPKRSSQADSKDDSEPEVKRHHKGGSR